MIEYKVNNSSNWYQLPHHYKINPRNFAGGMLRINDKVFTEFNAEFVEVYNKEKMWEKLIK